MAIKLLPEEVILKIAAGEVIERPASVVKELLENSIDSKADAITISIEGNDISILDNGVGMSQEDLKICHFRHATSKIKVSQDLFDINSLGFRGEALASISAVSLMTITSKTINESTANTMIIEGGREISFSRAPFSYESGTSIEVKDLFFNTPARKKYMKSDLTENRVITELVSNYMIHNELISFKLIINGKTIINVPKDTKIRERFYSIYGKDAKNMLVLDELQSDAISRIQMDLLSRGISVTGIISKPQIYRKTRGNITIFVNDRLIKSGVIYSAISNAYKGFLNTGEHPVMVLKIKTNPKKIDVNVHPTKQEVKFEDESIIYKSIYHTIRESLLSCDISVNVKLQDEQKLIDNRIEQKILKFNLNYELNNSKEDKISNQTILNDGLIDNSGSSLEEIKDKNNNNIKVLGIYTKEFVVCENTSTKQLVLIDFHAAAEIVNYEVLVKQFENRKIEIQSLIKSEIVELSLDLYQIAVNEIDFLNSLGFIIEDFGNKSIIVRAVPLVLSRNLDKQVLQNLLEEMRDNKFKNSIYEIKDKIIMRMACRISEKAGDDLNIIQAQKIVSKLFNNSENIYNCPHGRPTIINFEKNEIEKMFKRIR